MSTTLTLVGARGGQGTSTVAAALALQTADEIPTTLLTHDPVAMARLLGASPPVATERFVAGPNLTLAGLDEPPGAALTVVDAGPATAATKVRLPNGERYAVVRGPCYLALATLVSLPALRLDGVILVAEPGRALSAADTSEILGLPVVATVPVRSSIARLIDAGLLAGKPSEVPGLEHLRHSLLHGAELPDDRGGARSRCLVTANGRLGADRDLGRGWEHDR